MEHNEKQNEINMGTKPSSSHEEDIVDELNSSSLPLDSDEGMVDSDSVSRDHDNVEEDHTNNEGQGKDDSADAEGSKFLKLIDKVKSPFISFWAIIKEEEIKKGPKPSPFNEEDIVEELDVAASEPLAFDEGEENDSFVFHDNAETEEDYIADLSEEEDEDDWDDEEESALSKQIDRVRIPIISFIEKEKENTGVLKGMFYALLPVIIILLLSGGMTLSAVGKDRLGDEEILPESTDVYYYVSGVEMYASIYEDNSIRSDELARLENGDPVEFLYKENYKFAYVFDPESGVYGYMFVDQLVSDIAAVDYDQLLNPYEDEDSLGYYYVTNTKNGLTIWENPDGSGEAKAKMENGCKVSLLEETNGSYWYVFDFQSTERGYVKKAYLTGDEDDVLGVNEEPEDKTIVGEYYVKGISSYLSLRSEPSSGASLRGKLYLGDKVGLIEKTSGSFWYVYSYSLGEYGYVAAAYLTKEDPTAEKEEEEEVVEPEEPEETEGPEETDESEGSDGSGEPEEPDATGDAGESGSE